MTREEFERGYAERSGMTLVEYQEHFLTLPCDCAYENCRGWAARSKKLQESIDWCEAPELPQRLPPDAPNPTPTFRSLREAFE